MHIAIVTTSFPDEKFIPGQEAAGTFVLDFARSLAKYAKVTVLAPGEKEEVQQAGNYKVYRFSVPTLPLSLLKLSNMADWAKILKVLFAGNKAVKHFAKNEKPDHMLALWVLPSGYWARNAQIPYSVWALGSDIWVLGKIQFVKKILKNVIRNSSNCFADGYILANDVTTISGIDCEFMPSSRLLVIQERELRKMPPYRLTFLGRWHPNKGVDLLLDGLKLLNQDDWNRIQSIEICGGGPLECLVINEIDKLRADGFPVFVRGYLDKDESEALLYETDFLIIPSRIESIPVVFSDALQAKCPIIAMPVGDLPRLINDFGVGVIAEHVSSKALAKAIHAALSTSPHFFCTKMEKCEKMFNIEMTAKRISQIVGKKKIAT